MKRAAAALRAWLINDVGLEGGFLTLGIGALAYGASWFGPQWPWLVVGATLFVLGLTLARPR